VLILPVEQFGKDMVGESADRQRGDRIPAPLMSMPGPHRVNSTLKQPADQVERLVGGVDAATDDQQDALLTTSRAAWLAWAAAIGAADRVCRPIRAGFFDLVERAG
jgi:hypothetical protein